MASTMMGSRSFNAGNFAVRHAWKILPVVMGIIGLFGIGDLFNGAADLQSGEAVYMHSITGTSWNELQASSPLVARMIDTIFRTNGVTLLTVSLLGLSICLTAFRRGERWAWFALWAFPLWMGLTAITIASVEKLPGSGTPVPVISGTILGAISALALLLSIPRFFSASPKK